MCVNRAQCVMTRTTCFMVLLRTVRHQDGIEIGSRRQCDAGRAFANDNGAGLLGVSSVFLVGLDRDAVRARWHGLVLTVEAFPDQFVSSWRPRGTCDGTEHFLVS